MPRTWTNGSGLALDATNLNAMEADIALGGWTQVVNESGASLTNWTQSVGTWTTDGTSLNSTSADQLLKYTAPVPTAQMVIEFEMNVVTGPTSYQYAGIFFGWGGVTGTYTGTANCRIEVDGSNVWGKTLKVDNTGVAARLSLSGSTYATYNTWHKMRLVSGNGVAVYWDGVYMGTAAQATSNDASYFGLRATCSTSISTKFKNIKAWIPTLPA